MQKPPRCYSSFETNHWTPLNEQPWFNVATKSLTIDMIFSMKLLILGKCVNLSHIAMIFEKGARCPTNASYCRWGAIFWELFRYVAPGGCPRDRRKAALAHPGTFRRKVNFGMVMKVYMIPLCSNPFCKWFWSGFWVPKDILTGYLQH